MLQSVQTAHALISPTCGKAVDGTQYLHERDRTQEVLVCRWCAGTFGDDVQRRLPSWHAHNRGRYKDQVLKSCKSQQTLKLSTSYKRGS